MNSLDNKKAQAALEYLQTYGWAILVVMVIGITIWQLGLLGREKVNTASGFEKIKILKSSIKYSKDMDIGALNFSIMNPLGTRIKIKINRSIGDCSRIWFAHEDSDSIPEGVCNNMEGIWIPPDTCRYQSYVKLNPGETRSVEYAYCGSLHRGEQFEVYLIFLYRIKLGSEYIWFKDDGYLRGYAE